MQAGNEEGINHILRAADHYAIVSALCGMVHHALSLLAIASSVPEDEASQEVDRQLREFLQQPSSALNATAGARGRTRHDRPSPVLGRDLSSRNR